MQIGQFRKNVMKTVNTKTVKAGIRQVSRNTLKANIAHSGVSLAVGVGNLVQALSQYVLGEQIKPEMKEDALIEMGNVGYHLVVLARVLKVKLPSSTKKIKLQGTRTAALIELQGVVTDFLEIVGLSLFEAPPTTTVKKMVVMPNKGGAKEERDTQVIDVAAEAAKDQLQQTALAAMLTDAVQLYWKLCFSTFEQPPVIAFENKFARMQKEYPGIEFDTSVPTPKPKAAKTAESASASTTEAPETQASV